jgi:hypothetical protein
MNSAVSVAPISGQAADEGGIGVARERVLDLPVQPCEPVADDECFLGELADEFGCDRLTGEHELLRACRRERLLGELFDVRARQTAGPEDVGDEPACAGAADLGRADVAAKQDQARFLCRVDDAFEAGVDRGQEVARAADPACLVGDELAAAADEQAQLDVDLVAAADRAQINAGAHLVGDYPRVARVTLVFTTAGALPSAVDGEPGHVHKPEARVGEHRGQKRGDPADHVDANDDGAVLASQPLKLVDQRLNLRRLVLDPPAEQLAAPLVDRGRPVKVLRNIDPNRYLHLAPSVVGNHAQSPPAVLALHSDRSQSPISSPEETAERRVVPPEPSTAASMKTIPAPPAHPTRSNKNVGHEKKGRAA